MPKYLMPALFVVVAATIATALIVQFAGLLAGDSLIPKAVLWACLAVVAFLVYRNNRKLVP